jgi:hypothetical protein
VYFCLYNYIDLRWAAAHKGSVLFQRTIIGTSEFCIVWASEDEEVYPIDLQTLLRVLAQQSGELHTNVKNVGNVKGECSAYLVLHRGKVTACVIENANGSVLKDADAFRFLWDQGILEWKYIPAREAMLATGKSQALQTRQPAEHTSTLGAFPVRIQQVPDLQRKAWSLTLRSIYNLSTGENSVEEISRVLAISHERVLADLKILLTRHILMLHTKRPRVKT